LPQYSDAMSATIREAIAGEEERILAIYEWLFAPPGSKPPQWDESRARLALDEAIVSPQSSIFLAEDGDALVGFCTAYLELNSVRFGQRCWVEDLAVDPERRSEGIGAALLDAAKSWARGAGATHLELDSALDRTDAHRFYDRERPSWKSYSYSWLL
jgi:GNAT superfamily N-acetyltransferase